MLRSLVGNQISYHLSLTSTPERIEAEVCGRIETVGAGGGYVISSSNSLTDDMKPVIWTDVTQFFVTTGGLFAVLFVVLWAFGGSVSDIWRLCAETGHTRLVALDYSPFVKTTLWWLILGTGLNGLGAYNTDQVLVQRYLATKSRRDMVSAIAFNGMLSVPQLLCLFCAGLGLTAYYKLDPSLRITLRTADQVLPHFIVNVLPTGIAGLVIAGMLAATMSSVSAGINSLSTATTIDFIQRFHRSSSVAQTEVRTAKWIALLWGLMITLPAVYIGRLGAVAEVCITVIGFFTGPLLAMFLLGVLTTRTNQTGVLLGAIAGTLAAWYVSTREVSGLLWGPTGCVTSMVVGYLLSYLFAAPHAQTILPLTVWASSPPEAARTPH
jgi:sodium-coupled monocarboxylate transporter 8/12